MKPTFDYSSVFKIGSHGLVSLVVSGFIANVAVAAPASNALPTGGAVVSGNVNIATNAATMNINQASSKSVINWNTYNIGSAATVNYNFAQSGSSSLNRVLSNNPSEIYGKLNANGKVILVNPNGIVFGSGSSVNVGSLVATTMNIKDADYLNDKLVFTRDGSIGKILNEGAITAEDKGYIALLAPEVVNKGVIKAVMGTVSMAAGEKIELTLDASGLKTVILEPSTIKTLVDNKALIEAKGGIVYLGAKEASAILDTVMNLKNSGIVEASTMNSVSGKIILDGDNIEVDGTLKATEVYAGNKNNAKTLVKATATLEGDFVETSGKSLKVEDGVTIKAKNWLIDPVDFTIAASGGDISGATLSSNLNGGSVTIQSSQGSTGVNGDINVNDDVTWSTNKLTLEAAGNININANLNARSNASLDMKVGYDGSTYDATKAVLVGKNSDGSFKGKVSFYTDAGTTARSGTGFLSINGNNYSVITDKTLFSSTIQANLAGYYALGADLANQAIVPIGAQTNPVPAFTGSFNGLGHSMTGITLNTAATPSYMGLFQQISSTASLSNLSLNISGTYANQYLGGLVGYSTGGKISNVHLSGSLTSNYNTSSQILYLGGIVGQNYGGNITINNASVDMQIAQASTATQISQSYIGGIIGQSRGTDIISNSKVFSTTQITYNTANKTVDIGGVVGHAQGSISLSNLYSAATINVLNSGTISVGGIIGNVASGNLSDLTSEAILNFPNVTSVKYIGGVIGNASMGTTLNVSNIKFLSPGKIDAKLINSMNGGMGGLAGGFKSAGTVDGGEVTGGIYSYLGRVGGAIGEWQGGTVKNFKVSTNNLEVLDGQSNIGGIVGISIGGVLESSEFSGTMTLGNSMQRVGGLIGYAASGGTIKNSSVTGSATVGTNSQYFGGLLGQGGVKLDSNSFGGTFSAGAGSKYVASLAGSRNTPSSASEEYLNNTVSKTITIDGVSPTANIGATPTFHGKLIGDGTLSTYSTNNIYGTLVAYTLGTGGSYVYDGTSHLLSNEWSTANIFAGTDYDGWVLGTDYVFKYNNAITTSFTNAGSYSNIIVDILKDGFAAASTGNTAGALTIAKRPVDITVSKDYDSSAGFTTGFTLGNIVSGQTITISSGSASVSSANPNVYNSFASNTLVLSDATNYTFTGGTVSATINKLQATYTLPTTTIANNAQISAGTAIVLPTPTLTSGTPSATPTVKVYDGSNNDVTADAIAGRLAAGAYTLKTVINDAIYDVSNASDTIAFSVIAATPTTNSPVEVVVSQIADNVVKNVEKTIVAPQTTTPTVVAGASQVVTPPSVVQVVQPVSNEGSAAQGGAIVNTGGSTQISLAVAANSNPFASNENISVLSGGVKVASAELPTDVKSDVKPAGIVGAAPASMVVVKQFAPQKGVELALVAPSTNTADSKVAAKVNTEAGSGFSFTVKEAVNVNVAQKDIKEVKATLDNGQALPAWLQFDAKTQTFKAVNPPANALPISTKVSITTKAGQTQQIAVEIAK